MHLLILRPNPAGSESYLRLEKLNHRVSHFPISKQCALDTAVPISDEPAYGSVITSARAVDFFKEKITQNPASLSPYLNLPLFTVGDKTAQKARELGFQNIISAKGDGAKLAKLIATYKAMPKGATLLYLCAEKRHFDLAAALKTININIAIWPIYQSIYAKTLPSEIINSIKNGAIDGICHYSALSAKHFFYLLEKQDIVSHIEGVKHFTLSLDVSRNIPIEFERNIEIAAAPNEDALLDLIKNS